MMSKTASVLALVAFMVQDSLAGDCTSQMGTRCKPKSEMGGFGSYMQGGDPCFLWSGDRMCFVSMGSMEPCTCVPDCGCSGEAVKPPPKCDNSAAPPKPDCTADKTNFCPMDEKNSMDGKTYKNTMCLYCGVDLAKCNNAFCQNGITDKEQAQIVKKHNDLRRQVAKGLESKGVGGGQPKAANMFKLKWNVNLAISAQRWTDQCPQGHDHNRLIAGFKYVGQNMADSWSSANMADKGLDDKVMGWYNEVKDWPSANIAKWGEAGATGVVGHYTQVAWGPTTEVGCGYIYYKDVNQPSMPYRKTLMCNYGIGANMMGAEMYKVGEPGSACPNGADDGLCL